MKLGLALSLTVALVAAGCGDNSSAAEDGITVVATTTILGDVASNIVDDDGTVIVLTPIGADPHDFQLSAAQVATLNQADLVIANGLFLEEGMEDVLEASAGDGVAVLEVALLLDPLPFGFEAGHDHEDEDHHEDEDKDDHDDHEDEDDHGDDDHEDDEDHADHEDEDKDDHDDHEDEDDHAHGSLDPHVWFDPLRMADAGREIAAALAAIDPETDWASRAENFATELTAADAEIAEELSAIAPDRRLLVTNHDSLGYFADRYGFEVVGVVIPGGSTLADPSSAELAELIEEMEAAGATTIFGETTQPSALAEAVAAELGSTVEVVPLYTGSLGEAGSGADTLIDMLTTNAERIARALG